MNNEAKQILLTNDDGILSPGLWAAAGILAELGYVTVVAPREQYSGAGRSLPTTSDGIIETRQVQVNGNQWKVFAVGGSPAQAVLHGALEILPKKPDLVVSGINFGDNLGTGITISGTVGAALEAAGLGIPALAISLETLIEDHYSLSDQVDFSTAAHFTRLFAGVLLEHPMPADVDVLKVDVPLEASVDTPWETTRISRVRLFEATKPERHSWGEPGRIGYRFAPNWTGAEPGTDIHSVRINKHVSVTPLSLDLTSRLNLEDFDSSLRE
ncbi:MAG: 5'/3'-nucleotidase SurE [Anaerolineales bacterium]|nr:5'/3'-nucleotidase SurE [Anaerolineales bacterium]